MLSLLDDAKIYLAVQPVDTRKSFDGLCAVISEVLNKNPLTGHVFLFRGKRGDRIKALWWDRNGLVVWCNRLEKVRFKWPQPNAKFPEITEIEFSLLLDGVDFTRLKQFLKFYTEFSL